MTFKVSTSGLLIPATSLHSNPNPNFVTLLQKVVVAQPKKNETDDAQSTMTLITFLHF